MPAVAERLLYVEFVKELHIPIPPARLASSVASGDSATDVAEHSAGADQSSG
jgi:hypothetical protein